MRTTKQSLTLSLTALLLCFSMLLGTTYAWFTDSATSSGNIIQSGELDIEMYWSDSIASGEWTDASKGPIFTYDNWEPGYTDIKYIKVKNAGNLAFNWRLSIAPQGDVTKLAEVIDVYFVNPVTQSIDTLSGLSKVGRLSDVIENKTYTSGALLPKGEVKSGYDTEEVVLAVIFHMDDTAGNEYQALSIGDGFSVTLIASQLNYEVDSFGSSYDELFQAFVLLQRLHPQLLRNQNGIFHFHQPKQQFHQLQLLQYQRN